MPSLSETQSAVRAAVVASNFAPAAPLLVGGSDPSSRLAIHRRHYHASLIDTLRGRFPATAWLIGDGALTTAAAAYVIAHPPRVFCMAEFGATFPAWLAGRDGLRALPYLAAFAALEWEVGRVSVAVTQPALDISWLPTVPADTLGTAGLVLQTGAAWLAAEHNVDDLMRTFLSGDAPDRFVITADARWIEVRGARGDIDVRTLPAGEWHFRRALASGASIESAAVAALDADPGCDPGGALVHLIADGLVVAPRSSI